MLHEGLHSHSGAHGFSFLNGRAREGLIVFSRRSMLKASLAGLAGLTLPGLLQARGEAVKNGKPIRGNKSVILLWMAGGPSHIDTWDVKPDMPTRKFRGPFRDDSEQSCLAWRICEYPAEMRSNTPTSALSHPFGRLSREPSISPAQHGVADRVSLRPEPRINPKGDMSPCYCFDCGKTSRGKSLAGHSRPLRGIERQR
jgi:hypothetical protein